MLFGKLPQRGGVVVIDDTVEWQPIADPFKGVDVVAPWQQVGLLAHPPLTQQHAYYAGLQKQSGVASIKTTWGVPDTDNGSPYYFATRQYGVYPGAQLVGAGGPYAGASSQYQLGQAVKPSALSTAENARQALLNMWVR